MVKKGDTLVEVLLAVGIFSMIAISVVAVMSGGTSSAQTALETTLAREEIDAQAEALRYIHDSYINDKNSNNSELSTVALWRRIINQDNVYVPSGEKKDEDLLQYSPTTCPTSASELPANAFILDTRSLNLPGGIAYKSVKEDADVFAPATTSPRLIFGAGSENSLIESDTSTALSRAEGIYVIAVADKDTTTVLDIDGEKVEADNPAFFDFYIRTCWYGTDAETASTISTVIRLHNPDIQTQYYKYSHSVHDEFGNVVSSDGIKYQPTTLEDRAQVYNQPGWEFLGWCYGGQIISKPGDPCTGTIFKETKFYNTDSGTQAYDFYPAWHQIQYTINYDLNGGSWNTGSAPKPQKCLVKWGTESQKCAIQMPADKQAFTRSGYEFKGWCNGQVDDSSGTCNGKTYPAGQANSITAPGDFSNNNPTINLKAIWKENDEEITIRASWTSNTDYDSFMYLQKPDSDSYQSANWGTTNINVNYGNRTYSLITGAGDGRGESNGRYYENFVIHTLGGKNYYYAITKYSGGWPNGVGKDITVTVTGSSIGTKTFRSSSINCPNGYWNVFAYKNGKIISRNTCSSEIQYSY
ncbi:hypothetical protein IKD67_03500 [Candidatus Saccharibacteria bacterium]|nr:hypothetical protein [Candidatus Saccharibacteria bacterium]